MTTLQDQFVDVLVGIDEAFATAFFDGTSDITISSRCGMALLDGGPPGHKLEDKLLKELGEGLNDIQKDHCYHAIVGDWQRAQTIIEQLGPYMAMLQAKGLL